MDKILAKVGTLTVNESEVDEFLLSLGQRGKGYNTPEGRKVILNQIIGNKLLLLDARRNLLEADPEFKAELQKLKESLLVSFATNKLLGTVSVSDKEAKEYYDSNSEQFVSPKSANASHILVDSEDKANEILEKIGAGEISFEDAAREYSSCPSKENGGSLGEFGEGQMVAEFNDAVFNDMEVGTVTKTPVKTQFGYHIIKLVSRKDSETMPYEDIKDQLKEMLLGEKRQKAYESKINQLKIMYPVDMVL